MGNCDLYGRFVGLEGSFAMIFDFVAMEQSHEISRCKRCTEEKGQAQSNARPYDMDMSRYQWMIK